MHLSIFCYKDEARSDLHCVYSYYAIVIFLNFSAFSKIDIVVPFLQSLAMVLYYI